MRYVVLDTNVLLSALLCRKRSSSVPLQILQYVFARKLLPVFNQDILDEYEEVLHRSKFRFSESLVRNAIDAVINVGIAKEPLHYDGVFPDPDDRVFFEVAWNMYQEAHETYLVTGNIRHYPKEDFLKTPRQLLDIIERTP